MLLLLLLVGMIGCGVGFGFGFCGLFGVLGGRDGSWHFWFQVQDPAFQTALLLKNGFQYVVCDIPSTVNESYRQIFPIYTFDTLLRAQENELLPVAPIAEMTAHA